MTLSEELGKELEDALGSVVLEIDDDGWSGSGKLSDGGRAVKEFAFTGGEIGLLNKVALSCYEAAEKGDYETFSSAGDRVAGIYERERREALAWTD